MDHTGLLRTARRDLGEMLWRLSLKAAKEDLTLKAVEEAVAEMRRRRHRVRGSASIRVIARHVRDTARIRIAARIASGRQVGEVENLHHPSLEARLAARTAQEVTALARGLFRNGAPGGGSFDVSFARSAQEICYEMERDKNWNVYRGTRYPALIDRHVIRVERDWLRRVRNTGLSIVDRALTLSVSPCVATEPGIEIFAARRARQGRGYDVLTEAGFIARDRRVGLLVWAPAADRAVRKILQRRDEIVSMMSDSGLDEAWLHQHGHVHATRRDAYEAGSCRQGVEEWLENAGLAHLSSAPLALLHAAWLRDPRDHARVVMKAVAHRSRRT